MMVIQLNGKERTITGSTLTELIVECGLDSKALIAELNYEIVPQKNWQKTVLNDGDKIELLSFVGGG